MSRIFFNILTVPDQRLDALARARMSITVPANYKTPEAIEKYKQNHLAETHAKTAQAGISGQICSLSWSIDNNQIYSLTRGIEVDVENESGLLRAFFDAIHRLSLTGEGAHSTIEWIGHNIIEHGLRFLKQRSLILGVQPLFKIPADARHDGGKVFDTMQEWAGFRGYVKQSELQKVLDIDADKNICIDGGPEIRQFWEAARYHDIAAKNRDDVGICQQIYRRLRWGA